METRFSDCWKKRFLFMSLEKIFKSTLILHTLFTLILRQKKNRNQIFDY